MADIRCPMCGKPNPGERDTCKFCQARLKPVSGPPASPAASDQPPLPDWLSSLRGADSGPAAPAQNKDSELPAWLSGSERQAPASPPSSAGGLPDWLADLGGRDQRPAPAAPKAVQATPFTDSDDDDFGGASEGGTFDWLSDLRSDSSAQGSAVHDSPADSSDEAGSADADGSDWLSRLGALGSTTQVSAEPPAKEPEPVKPPAAEPLPDWLSHMAAPGAVVAAASAPQEADDDFGWLNMPAAPQAAPPKLEQAQPEPVPGDDVPDWLKDMRTTDAPPSSAPVSASIPPAPVPVQPPAQVWQSQDVFAPADGGLTDWMAEFDDPLKAAALGAASASAAHVSPFTDDEGGLNEFGEGGEGSAPGWMTAAGLTESRPAAPDESALAPAELPTWLEAMRPVTAVTALSVLGDQEETIEKAGPLSGLRGVLNSGGKASHRAPALNTHLEVTEVQQAKVDVLQALIKAEGEPGPLPGKAVFTSQRISRILIAVILMVAIVIPLVLGAPIAALPPVLPEIEEAFGLIQSLPTGAPVLVGVDFDAGQAGELTSAARPVLTHLLMQNRRLVLVTTLPNGLMQADLLMDQLSTVDRPLTAGDDYINLGFVAGGAAGLLGFAQTPPLVKPMDLYGNSVWGQGGYLADVRGLDQFGLVLLLTDSPDTARSWIEQAAPFLKSVPLVMVVGAQAEPMILPYYQATDRQVSGLVAGLAGGVAYETLIGLSGTASQAWNGFSLGILAAGLMILIGGALNIGITISRRIQQDREKKS